jgi:LysM repeat protein
MLQIEQMFDEHMFERWREGVTMAIRMVNTPAVRVRRWILATGLAVLALVLGPQAFANDAAEPGASDTYVVSQGETLWSIAQSVTPAGEDVRETVATIQSMNMLASSTIMPGQQLLVPLAG